MWATNQSRRRLILRPQAVTAQHDGEQLGQHVQLQRLPRLTLRMHQGRKHSRAHHGDLIGTAHGGRVQRVGGPPPRAQVRVAKTLTVQGDLGPVAQPPAAGIERRVDRRPAARPIRYGLAHQEVPTTGQLRHDVGEVLRARRAGLRDGIVGVRGSPRTTARRPPPPWPSAPRNAASQPHRRSNLTGLKTTSAHERDQRCLHPGPSPLPADAPPGLNRTVDATPGRFSVLSEYRHASLSRKPVQCGLHDPPDMSVDLGDVEILAVSAMTSMGSSTSVMILVGNGMLTGTSTLKPEREPDADRQDVGAAQPAFAAWSAARPGPATDPASDRTGSPVPRSTPPARSAHRPAPRRSHSRYDRRSR